MPIRVAWIVSPEDACRPSANQKLGIWLSLALSAPVTRENISG
jgi:hypothetical protein